MVRWRHVMRIPRSRSLAFWQAVLITTVLIYAQLLVFMVVLPWTIMWIRERFGFSAPSCWPECCETGEMEDGRPDLAEPQLRASMHPYAVREGKNGPAITH